MQRRDRDAVAVSRPSSPSRGSSRAGHSVRPRSGSSIWAGSLKPSARNAACIRAAPISSAIRAVAMFDEWTSRISGTLSARPSGWSSLIVNRPIGTGAGI